MRRTAELRRLWDPPCEFERRDLTLFSGATLRGLNVLAHEGFQALDAVMRTFGYVPRANSSTAWETGAYNCRRITNGTGYSLHAYGIAADINARTNPYGKTLITDMPPAMVTAAKGIRTLGGIQVFRWGGDYSTYKDAMHWEVVASPEEMTAGIDWNSVVAEPPDEGAPSTWPTLRKGDRGPSVKRLNALLAESSFDVAASSVFSARTRDAVRAYQRSRRLTVDGIVGPQTWTSLLNQLPELVESEPSPFKVEVRKHPDRPLLKPGAEGCTVEEMQRRLGDDGFEPGDIDGVFGSQSKAALVAFQRAGGLETDGICGPVTWRALLSGA